MGCEIERTGDRVVNVTVVDMPEGVICQVTEWPDEKHYIGKPIHRWHIGDRNGISILGQGIGKTIGFDKIPPGVRARVLASPDILRIT
jgi:hypothetical protein